MSENRFLRLESIENVFLSTKQQKLSQNINAIIKEVIEVTLIIPPVDN